MRQFRDYPAPSPHDTLRAMRALAQQGANDMYVREKAQAIVERVWDHDFLSEYAALLNWVRRNVRYVRDPISIEQVQTPRATLEVRQGDCDDMATLLAALIGSLGGRVDFVAGAFKSHRGRPILSHVWAEALDPNTKSWIVLDPVPGRRVQKMLNNLVSTLRIPAVE